MNDSNAMVYAFGDYRLDPRRRVLAHADGREVEITAKAFDALVYLIEHAGTVVTRSALAEALWPRTIVEDHNLNKLVMVLRRALADGREQRYIATLQGRGYQFVADVRAIGRPLDGASLPNRLTPAPIGATSMTPPAASRGRGSVLMRTLPAALAAVAAIGIGLLVATATVAVPRPVLPRRHGSEPSSTRRR